MLGLHPFMCKTKLCILEQSEIFKIHIHSLIHIFLLNTASVERESQRRSGHNNKPDHVRERGSYFGAYCNFRGLNESAEDKRVDEEKCYQGERRMIGGKERKGENELPQSKI